MDDFWQYVTDLFQPGAGVMIQEWLGPDRCSRPFAATEIKRGEHYVRIWLAQMYLKDRHDFLDTYLPAVHGVVRANLGGIPTVIPNIADSSRIALKPVDGAGVAANNYDLSPILPYNGGDIAIEAGLVSVRTEKIFEQFLKTLTDFSDLLKVTQVTAAVKVAVPLAKGIQGLFGDGDGKMHLGFHNTFSARENDDQLANPLKQGYLAVVRARDNQLNRGSLWVHDDTLHIGSSLAAAQTTPLTSFDYMLFRFEVFTERNDWEDIVTIKELYDQSLSALDEAAAVSSDQQAAGIERARGVLRQAQKKARSAPELTLAHRRIVSKRLEEKFDQAVEDIGLAHAFESAPSLNALMAGIPDEEIAREAAAAVRAERKAPRP